MKRILLALLVLLIAIQLVVAALLGTEPGSRWLINRLLPLVPGELQIRRINGTILDGVTIHDAAYRNSSLAVQLSGADIAMDISRMWQGTLQANHFYLDGLQINLLQTEPKTTERFELPDTLALPFGIIIRSARVRDLLLIRNQQQVAQLELLELEDASMRGELDLGKLSLQHQQHQLELNDLHMELTSPYPLDAKLRWQSELPVLRQWLGDQKVAGDARLGGSLLNLAVRHHLRAPQQIESQIEVAPFSATGNFTSQHQWQQLAVTLPDQQAISFSSGTLSLDSDQHNVSLVSASRVNLPGFIDGQLSIEASGDWQQARSLKVIIKSEQSELRVHGTAAWQPDLSFNLIADGRNINPALLDPRIPGNINLSGNLSGARRDNRWRMTADSVALKGLLRAHPIQATLHAALADSVLSLNGNADYGNNLISIDGRINQMINLHSRLQLLSPENLHPDLRGDADITLQLSGSRSQPLLDIDLRSNRFGFAQYTVDNISVQGRKLGLASQAMQFSARSDDVLYYNKSLLNSTTLQLDGSHRQHRLSWSLHQDAAQLSGSARGAMENLTSGWHGVVDQLRLSLADFPDWQLSQPAALSLSAGQQLLEQTCLSNGAGKACAEASADSQQLSASLAISALPLAPFSALLGPDIRISGELEHTSKIRRDPDNNWHGALHSTLNGTSITFDDGPVDYSIALSQAEFAATLEQQQIESRLNLILSEHGYLQASLNTLTQPDAALRGQLDIAITELRWLELMIPGIRQRSGSLAGQLTLTGTRTAPGLRGAMTLEDGETDIAGAGLTLRDIHATLNAEGKQLRISGGAKSGPGSVDVTGHLDLDAGLPGQLDLQLTGERFQIVDLPEASVLINPSVTLSGDARLFRLRGDIDIPEARLTPVQLPEMAVRVSEDQVIVNSLQAPSEPLLVDAELMLRIGKAVRFNGFGLDARLGGNLQFIMKPEQPTNLLGDLRIEEGRYRAYGQNLAIEQGLLLFQEKIDNPGLNIRAVRRIPSAQVVAGVAITGTLQKPQARLVSEPAMEESEIMAWLLTGRGLTAGSESDNAMIAQALAVYGLEQGSGVTEKIGDKLGIDEIAVGSDWETSDASLMLGKQISDRLYLRYAIGLFDAVSTVMLRYTLSRRLHLEAQSGSNRQSLDLIYQVER